MSSQSVSLPVVGSVKLMHIALVLGALAAAYWYFKVYKTGPKKEVVPEPPQSAATVVTGTEKLLPFKQFNRLGQAQQPIILFEQSRQAADILGSASSLIIKRVHLGTIHGSNAKIMSAVPLSALKVGQNRVVTENMTVQPWELGSISMDRNALNNLMTIQGDPIEQPAADGSAPVAASSRRSKSLGMGRGELGLYVVASVM